MELRFQSYLLFTKNLREGVRSATFPRHRACFTPLMPLFRLHRAVPALGRSRPAGEAHRTRNTNTQIRGHDLFPQKRPSTFAIWTGVV